MFAAADLFDLTQTRHGALFADCTYAWEALRNIGAYLEARLQTLAREPAGGGRWLGENIFIGAGTVVEAGAVIKGPALIGSHCQIRHNAYVRENVLVGDDCVVGNACELKNVLLFNGCQVPHFNYVGDSILGARAHLGAGVIASNLRTFPGNVTVELNGVPFDTGLRKFGALIGDRAEIGCNSVLNPGSIVGRGATIYPGVNWRGFLPANNIAKNKAAIEVVVRRPRAT
ncbi:MAG TPA: UDP-N-acetylglucosamine diphosphorylase [Verrucomicrobiota bacterium]|nr:UDP-N-acetylglucosamine diphosphorylase [Verrucomicrobiota bacterium]HNT15962.1 UDP-N-acetylglucosamine diphosphorylase [Verrucomicrobiota bacterium]